jgi:hypothetical protein
MTKGLPMKLRTLAIAALTVTGLTAGIASSASADDTDATFTLTGGDLTLSVQPTAALTGSVSGDTSISGDLGAVSVTDARGGTEAWTVSAASTAFTGALGSSSTAVSYTGGTVTETGTITVADGAATALTVTAVPVVDPSSLSGNNTASWNAALAVTMPAGALADDYSGTVTTSIL